MREAGTPNSQRASITSRPLFIRVAESIVILGPMRQVGWASASSRVTCAKLSRGPVAERPARRGEDQPLHVLRPAAVEALVQRAVLAVDRQQPRARFLRARQHQLARRRRASPCWQARRPCRPRARGRSAPGPRRPPRRRPPSKPRGGSTTSTMPVRADAGAECRDRSTSLPNRSSAVVAADGHDLRPVTRHLLGQPLDVAARREADDLEAAGERVDDPQHVRADRAGRAEDGKAFHFGALDAKGGPSDGPPQRTCWK